MKTKLIKITATALLIAASTANATLESRLSGKAFYDTETDLTWVAPEYVLPGASFTDQINALATYTLGGVSGWNVPGADEFIGFTFNNSAHPVPYIVDPIPPLNSVPGIFNPFYWVILTTSLGETTPFAYRPSLIEWYPGDIGPWSSFPVWPVHSGDVPTVGIPEPSTYAMLLAGLGLLGFMGGRRRGG